MKLALFDLDHTLIPIDSDHAWGEFATRIGWADAGEFKRRNDAFYEQYKAGTLDIHEFLDFQLKPLSRHPRRELDAWHADFMARHILPMVTEQGRELVRRHQAEGALTAIVTATNSFVTAPIARAFGIEHLIATEPERANGEFTGRVSGTPSFREGKIARVEAWLAGLGHGWQSFGRSWFYSDSLNDLPLLGKVTDPVAVDPDPTLERHARERGWPIITLR